MSSISRRTSKSPRSARFVRFATNAVVAFVMGSLMLVITGCGNGGGPSTSSTPSTGSAAVSINVAANPATIMFGNATLLTATLSNTTATGSITFKDSATVLGVAAVSGGTASYSAAGLTGGQHTVTAVYSGDANFAPVNGAAIVTVTLAATTASVSASASVIPYGGSVVLTAAISNNAATGSVLFKDGSTVLGVGTIASGGLASFNVSGLVVGTHSVAALYSGDTNFASSTSAAATITVTLAPTTTAITASPSTIAYGASTLLTTAVSDTAATGSVTFRDGSTVLSTVSIAGGSASFNATGLAIGTHAITAVYSGDGNFASSAGVPATVTVTLATTTTSLSATPMATTYGAPTVLAATISPAAATGSVTFKDGAAVLGSGPVANGSVSYTTTGLSGGTHSITAIYSGDTGYATSTSTATTVTVTPASTTTSVAANPSTIAYGAATLLTASVSNSSATGSITFKDGATILATMALSGGAASYSATGLAGGTHLVTAAYSGDSNLAPSTSTSLAVTVSLAVTTTKLSANPPAIGYGASTLLTATLSSGAAIGSITFTDGSAVLGSSAVMNGTASFTATGLASGTHLITAAYSGDTNFASSTSPAVKVAVSLAPTTTSLSANPMTLAYGASTLLTATISNSAATGSVVFKDGSAVLGSGAITNGSASFSATGLASSTHSIIAVYSGDTNFSSSTSAAATVTVTLATTTTTIAANPSTVAYGATVVLMATVSNSAATGTVTFKDGATVLGTMGVLGGSASYNATALAGGAHSMTASYSGDANFAPSISASATVNVTSAVTTTSLSANPTTLAYGASTLLKATLSNIAATGSVTFKDGANVLGTASLSGGSASYSATGLAGGAHSITAVYSGDANFGSSTSPSMAVTVTLAATTTSVTANPAAISYGASTLLTATVSTTAVTGSVTFMDGANVLGTVSIANGSAGFTATSLAAGTHAITAVYSGDTNFAASTSAATSVKVSSAATTISVSASPTTIASGSSSTLTALLSNNAATGSVTFKDGSTVLATVSVANGSASYSATALAIGSHSITAVYSGDSNFTSSTSTAVAVTVTLTATTTIVSANPSTVAYGSYTSLTATVSSSAATGSVTFQDGSTTLATVTLKNGAANYTAALGGGTHSITATYSGDTSYASSTSVATTVTVTLATTTIGVTANPSTFAYGSSTTLKATVSNTSATGSVTFQDGSTVLGTVNIASGSASLTNATLTAGAHSISAVYSGDSNFASSTSTSTQVTVTLAATMTSVTASPATIAYGASTLFTVSISSSAATGSVTFKDGTTVLGVGTVASGSAIFTATGLTSGSHFITAVYSGDANFASSTSASTAVTVTTPAPSALVQAYHPKACTSSPSQPGCLAPLSPYFTVSVTDANGVITTVPTYVMDRGVPSKNTYYSFAHFAFQGDVTVTVTPNESKITAAHVSPLALGIIPTVTNPTGTGTTPFISFPLTQSRYLIIKIDALTELVIAADPPETGVPASSGAGIFNVASPVYNADGTGATETTTALLQAIADAGNYATASTPAVVYVPDGFYIIGQIMLPSNVTLYLSGNAVLQAATNPQTAYIQQYTNGASNYGKALTTGQTTCGGCTISGFWFISTYPKTTNITIKGRGVIDGAGYFLLGQPQSDPAPVNNNAFLDVLMLPLDTSNFTVDGLVGWDSSGWSFTPVQSTNVQISNYKGMQSLETYQDDGIDVEESQGVNISHVITVTRDDSYSTKTWRQYTAGNSSSHSCWPSSAFYPNPPLSSSTTGVGMCWPLSLSTPPPPITDTVLQDIVSWTTDGGFKTGDGADEAQINLSVNQLYIYKAGYGFEFQPETTSGFPPISHITLKNVDMESATQWFRFVTTGTVESDITLSNVNVRSSSSTSSYALSATSPTGGITGLSLQNVSLAGTHVYVRSQLNGDLQTADIANESFLPYDSSNPIAAVSYTSVSPTADASVQATTDSTGFTDLLLTKSGDLASYDDINFGMSSPGITLRVNPSAVGVKLNFYAGSTSGTPVATWTSTTTGWQTTPVIYFYNSTGVLQPLIDLRGFTVGLANTAGTVHINWLQPVLNTFEAETATVSGGATITSCASCSGGKDVENITNGSVLAFPNLNFGTGSANTEALYLRLAAQNFSQGTLTFYLDSQTGTPIGSLVVSGTGGSSVWQNVPVPLYYSDNTASTTAVTGTHTLYIVASCANVLASSPILTTSPTTYPTCTTSGVSIANIDSITY